MTISFLAITHFDILRMKNVGSAEYDAGAANFRRQLSNLRGISAEHDCMNRRLGLEVKLLFPIVFIEISKHEVLQISIRN